LAFEHRSFTKRLFKHKGEKVKKEFVPKGIRLPRFTGHVIVITALACAPEPKLPRGKNEDDGASMSDSVTPGRRLFDLILEVVDTLTGREVAQADFPRTSERMSRVTLIFREIPAGTVAIRPRSNQGQYIALPEDISGGVAITIAVPMNRLVEPDLAFLDSDGHQIGRFYARLRTETFVATYDGLLTSDFQQVLRDHGEIITFRTEETLDLDTDEPLWLMGRKRLSRRLHLINDGLDGSFWIRSNRKTFIFDGNRLFPLPSSYALALSQGDEIGVYPTSDTDEVEEFNLSVTRAQGSG